MPADTLSYQSAPETAAPKKSFTRFIPHVFRVLMGLAFAVSGSNGLIHYLPEPKPEMPERALTFVTALMASGYMMPLIMTTQLVVGLLLLANRFVPLALVLLAPFMLNSLLFHIFLERSGLIPSAIFCVITVYLMFAYRKTYRPLFTARATPGAR